MENLEEVNPHPDPRLLFDFMKGELPVAQSKLVVGHLLQGCPRCVDEVAPTAELLVGGRTPRQPADYDDAVAGAFRSASLRAGQLAAARAAADREIAGLLIDREGMAELASPPDTGPVGLLAWARCEALLDASWALRYTDPAGMVVLAALAATLAEKVDPVECGAVHAIDLQARAWGELGNAHRVSNDLWRAERTLDLALSCAERGSGDPLLLAHIMDLTSSLYTDQRRFHEAAQLLDWVYRIYQRLGESHRAARALISKGISVGLANDCEHAIRLLASGLAGLDDQGDPALVVTAIHALIDFTVRLDRFTEGARLLALSRPLYSIGANPLNLLRLRWLEGKIALGLGDLGRAEADFLEVCDGFEQHLLPYTVAMVSLDLAALWLGQGRTGEARELVEEILETFRALHIGREAVAALLVLHRALERERATVALVRTVAARLRRLEDRPHPE